MRRRIRRKRRVKNVSIRGMVEAAIMASIVVLLFLIANNTPDSFVYMIICLPIIINVYRYDLTTGTLAVSISILVSFLFGNPIYIFIYLIPNLVVGLLIGFLERRSLNPIFKITISFISFLAIDVLAAFLVMKIMNINVLADLDLLKSINENLYNVAKALIPTVFVLYALCKSILIITLENIILSRLCKYIIIPYQIVYSKVISIAYLIALALTVICAVNQSAIALAFLNIFVIALIIIGFYLMLQTIIYFSQKNKGIAFSILLFIIFPFSIVFGLILNFKQLS